MQIRKKVNIISLKELEMRMCTVQKVLKRKFAQFFFLADLQKSELQLS